MSQQHNLVKSPPLPLPALESGVGAPLMLCLHGLFGGPQSWAGFMEAMADTCRVVVPELRLFHDWGGLDPEAPTLAQLRKAVAAFCEARQLTSLVLCGNSLGGQAAVDFCRHYRGMVRALILTGAAGLSERLPGRRGYIKVTREFIEHQARKTFFDPALVTPALVAEVIQRSGGRKQQLLLARLTKASSRFKVRDLLGEIKVPTLLIWGRQDQITPQPRRPPFRPVCPRPS